MTSVSIPVEDNALSTHLSDILGGLVAILALYRPEYHTVASHKHMQAYFMQLVLGMHS